VAVLHHQPLATLEVASVKAALQDLMRESTTTA
jgi:hypothetical protein